MAIPFVQSIDMNDFQLLNFVVHSAPSSPSLTSGGGMWWDSNASIRNLKVYNDGVSQWRPLTQGPTSAVDNNLPFFDGTTGGIIKDSGISVSTAIVATPGVDTLIPTEQAVREAIDAAVAGGVTYIGGYNAATDTPSLDDGTPIAGILQGDMYIVTVAGDFFTDTVDVGDMLIAIQDSPTLLTHWTVIAREWDETFLELGDTPASFTGQEDKLLSVNSATANAVVFRDVVDFTAITTIAVGDEFLVGLAAGGTRAITWANILTEITADITLDTLDDGDGITDFSYDGSGAATISLDIKVNSGIVIDTTELSLNLSASNITGTLAVGDGGTGQTSFTQYGVLYAPTTTSIGSVAASTTGTFLRGTSAGSPSWSTLILPNAATTADILVATATNTIGTLAKGAGNQHLAMNAGATALEWVDPPSGLGAHNILSADHADANTASVVIGDLVFGKDNTGAEWDRLPIGTIATHEFLISNGTIPAWGSITDLTGEAAIVTADSFMFYDATATDLREITYGQLVTALNTDLTFIADDQDLGFTASTGTVTITDGNDTTIGSFGTTNTNYGFVIGSNSVGATYFLNGAGAWAVPAYIPDTYLSAVTVNSISDVDFTITGGSDITAVDFSHTHDTIYPTAKIGYLTGSLATAIITHDFNLTIFSDVIVQVWRQSDNKQVGVEITGATKDTVTISFGAAGINPTETSFRYMVIGLQE